MLKHEHIETLTERLNDLEMIVGTEPHDTALMYLNDIMSSVYDQELATATAPCFTRCFMTNNSIQLDREISLFIDHLYTLD